MREADIRDRAKNRKERRRERFNRSNSEGRKRKTPTANNNKPNLTNEQIREVIISSYFDFRMANCKKAPLKMQ